MALQHAFGRHSGHGQHGRACLCHGAGRLRAGAAVTVVDLWLGPRARPGHCRRGHCADGVLPDRQRGAGRLSVVAAQPAAAIVGAHPVSLGAVQGHPAGRVGGHRVDRGHQCGDWGDHRAGRRFWHGGHCRVWHRIAA